MNAKFFFSFTLSLAFGTAVLAAEQGAASGTETGATAAVTAAAPAPAAQASTNAAPTEAEMRDAVQRYLDNFNAAMKAPAAPGTATAQPRYVYSPYWRYYGGYGYGYKNSQESNYENWTDVAKRAHNTARVEITSFKKISCKPVPDEDGFFGAYIAELQLRGVNPEAQGIMQTSGKRLEGFFYRGDKGWIFGEAKSETK